MAQSPVSNLYDLLAKTKDEASKATLSYRLAHYYDRKDLFDSALHWLNEAAMSFTLVNDDKAMGGCYFDMGKIYLKKAQNQEERFAALPNFDRAIIIFKKKKEKKDLAEALFEKGKLLHELGKSDEALPFLQEALLNFGLFSNEYKNKILECYNLLAKAYRATGDMTKYRFYNNAFLSSDLLEQNDPLEARRQKEIARKQAAKIDQLESQRLERELQIAQLLKEQAEAKSRAVELENQNLIQTQVLQKQTLRQNQEKINLQNTLNRMFVIVIVLSGVIIIFLLRLSQRNAASNRLLINEKRQTEKNSTSLFLENQRLNATLDELNIRLRELQINKRQLLKLNKEKDKFINYLENQLLEQMPKLISSLQKALTLREVLNPQQTDFIEKLYRSLRRYSKAKEN
jgi:hypothetical protein